MSVQGLSPSRSRPRCRNGIAPTVARHSEPTDTTGTRHERCSSGSPVYSVVEPRVGWAPLRSPGLLWRGYRGRCYRRLGRLPGITAWCRPGDTSGLGRQPGPDLTPQGLPRRISDPAGGGPGSGIIGVQRARLPIRGAEARAERGRDQLPQEDTCTGGAARAAVLGWLRDDRRLPVAAAAPTAPEPQTQRFMPARSTWLASSLPARSRARTTK